MKKKNRFGSIAYIYRKNKLEVLGHVNKRGKRCADSYNFTTVKKSYESIEKIFT